MSDGKVMIVHLIVWLIKKILLYNISYFPEGHTNKNKTEVDLDLSNYATKSDLKSNSSWYTWWFN